MNVSEARALMAGSDLGDGTFSLLQLISRLAGDAEADGRELLIRLLDHPDQLEPFAQVVNGLLARYGLFPYMDPASFSVGDAIAYEAHRPLDYDNEQVVFHRVQADVYRRLLDGESVILSAPTSFGKSLILDAVAASGRFSNIAVVVPTLALIDETRRRLSRLRDVYKIITHPSQTLADRNILVMTQERMLEVPDLPTLDLFMIDEFYKLDSSNQENRPVLLNQALRRLMGKSRAFYMAGPNVKDLSDALPETFTANFTATDFATVASNVRLMSKPARGEEIAALVEVCRELEGPTLVFCSSPEKTRRVAAALLNAGLGTPSDQLGPASQWIADEYHPEWLVARALPSGVGIHHARLPRWLGQYTVAAFNDGLLDFLVCTSTLIEGVNTSARNVVVFDHKIANRNIDYFTYSNIAGRSGRMLKHFVGEVVVFREPPSEELPIVDLPVYSQGPETPLSLLIHLEDAELTELSRSRLSEVVSNPVLPLDVLRESRGVDPERQIALANELRQNLSRTLALLVWSGFPTYDQLEETCRLVLSHLRPIRGRDNGVSSYRQLAFKLNLASVLGGDVKQLVQNELNGRNKATAGNPDVAVEEVLGFLRQWVSFDMPRLLASLQTVLNHVLQRAGRPERANYAAYIASCERMFLPAHVALLDEFGIPPQLVSKITRFLPPAESGIDAVLDALRVIDPSSLALSQPERQILRDVQGSI